MSSRTIDVVPAERVVGVRQHKEVLLSWQLIPPEMGVIWHDCVGRREGERGRTHGESYVRGSRHTNGALAAATTHEKARMKKENRTELVVAGVDCTCTATQQPVSVPGEG